MTSLLRDIASFLEKVTSLLRRTVNFLAGKWADAMTALRRWRWQRVRPERLAELTDYRMPIQVCPRGCDYHEAARKDLLARTALWGRVEMQVETVFETTNCPKCGTEMVKACARCKSKIFAPIVDRCQFCGRPQPWAAERRVAAERSNVRKWRPGVKGVHDAARKLYEAAEGLDLWVIDGDITHLEVDAVVSNADVDGQMWAEGASAIRKAAGEEVEQRAQYEKPYKLGEAWVTGGGDMSPPLKGIIHVASMNRRGESDLEVVQDCLKSALDQAVEKKFKSIGIGTFGSGPNAIDLNAWLRTFVEAAVPYLARAASAKVKGRKLSVLLVLFEPDDFDRSCRFLSRVVDEVRPDLMSESFL
ncbi:MAG TPA: macro domain-containing protein [Solirubrobacterales bacterium]|nr:macro domain-containing protein [Solirubrobacterales bacterium]